MSRKDSVLRIGLVGSRFAARFHLEGWHKVHGVKCEVVGVTSKSRESRDAFASQHGLQAFDTVKALAAAVDVVDVCAPPYVHEPAAIAGAKAGRHVVVEKPYTGAFAALDDPKFHGHTAPKQPMLEAALASCRRIREAVETAGVKLAYAENWVYAPPIQKEREIIEKTKAQVLWIRGEESHSGSHSEAYGDWRRSGGGALIGKAVHPLSAGMYLKRVEGETNGGRAIRPKSASARTHRITQLKNYRDTGELRTSYRDIEDYVSLHVVFDDDTVADIWTGEIVMGGINNWLEIMANNHRTRCSINPNTLMQTYNPKDEQFADIYVVEKIGTKQGWTTPAPDEDWVTGYPQEFQDFAQAFSSGREPMSGLELGEDTIATVYAGYLSAERKGEEVEIPISK